MVDMNDVNIECVTAVINEVRLLNNQLIDLVENLHRDRGITASQRAVLEFVDRSGPATVPTIARDRGVSRQHIQTIANELRSLELVDLCDNPAHRRSPMLTLSDRGRDAIDAILERERTYLASHVGGLDVTRLRATAATLAEMRAALGRRDR
jgi:DNA-binding MarR family transcriptional regulator